MFKPIIIYIGFSYFFRKKMTQLNQFAAYFSILTIILGITALITILSIMNGFEKTLEKKILNFIPHVLLISQKGSTNYHHDEKNLLKNLNGITYITPVVIFDAILQSSHNISLGTVIGINPKNFEPLSDFMINGSIKQLEQKKYYTIIGATLAEQLKVKTGDNIFLILPHTTKITPMGNIPTQRLFKIIGIYFTNTEVDSYQILINQEDGSRLMHYPNGHITGWRLWLKEPLKINNFNKKQLSDKFTTIDWRQREGSTFKTIQIEKNMMSLLLGSVIIISGFNIISFSCLLITEKKKTLLF